ncbi:MAG: ATP-dependent DNA ligase [Gemmatimonadota bacterium]|nr:MAG: ATP-dependent DNA ligase [Gemmatimonadota bacterium]
MLLLEIVETSRKISETRARLRKIAALTDLLRRSRPEEVRIVVAYLSGELLQGRIGIGPATLRGAFPDTHLPAPTLTLGQVDQTLERVAELRGTGSTRERGALLSGLLAQATREEQGFLARLILGELRQGALEGVMVEAIARAAQVPASEVRRALMLSGDLSEVAQAALSAGSTGLRRFSIQLFRPLQPMLAETAEKVGDVFERFERAALEYKLDGARVQVHRSGNEMRVYTRRLNDVTGAVPELVEQLRRLPLHEFILDGETLALRPDGKPHPFQVTMRRFGRRRDVERLRQQLPLSTYFFDILYLDGQDLIDLATDERIAALASALPDNLLVPRTIAGTAQEAELFLERALAAGHEGLMAKSLDAAYEAGRRGRTWLKLKPSHTLDLVVLAAEWGSGRRRGWLSNLHLGARDPGRGGFVMLGKTFKGLDDQTLAWQTERLQALEVARDAYTVYVRPELVAEIAFDGVQASAKYPGGLALRFARLRRYRFDKDASEADTIDSVRALHGQA